MTTMRTRFLGALLLALLLAFAAPQRAEAVFQNYNCDMGTGTSCPLSYDLWLFATCYGNGFLCWRAW
jgi:hypothetical protein